MYEIYLVKVPETVDLLAQTAPITIMTRSSHVRSYTFLMLVLPSITSFANNLDTVCGVKNSPPDFPALLAQLDIKYSYASPMTSPFVFAKLSVPGSALFWKLFHFAFGGRPNFFNKCICLRISFLRLGLIVPGHESLIANLLVKSFIFYFLDQGAKVFGRALVS